MKKIIEAVTKYHPDKVADQISDAIVSACLSQDKKSRVALETMIKGDRIYLCGEITTNASVDLKTIAAEVATKLKYPTTPENVTCDISRQSPEIAAAVNNEGTGAGDQGVMVGYATSAERYNYLPIGVYAAGILTAAIEKMAEGGILNVRGDAKVLVETTENQNHIEKVNASICFDRQFSLPEQQPELEALYTQVSQELRKALDKAQVSVSDKLSLEINPGGHWTYGGPDADTGLTGRKIVCDAYATYAPVGGGAFSGKDPTKVDRSAAYLAREIAKNLIKYHLDQARQWDDPAAEPIDCTVEISYMIGDTKPRQICAMLNLNAFSEELDEEMINARRVNTNLESFKKATDMLRWDFEKLAGGSHFRFKDWRNLIKDDPQE